MEDCLDDLIRRSCDVAAVGGDCYVRVWVFAQLSIYGKADDVDVDGVGEDGDDGCVVGVGAGCDAGVVVAEAGSGEWGFGGLEDFGVDEVGVVENVVTESSLPCHVAEWVVGGAGRAVLSDDCCDFGE